jgi:hypothetical protein
MTDRECARNLCQAIVKELRRVAEENGITLQGKEDVDDRQFTWTYRKGSNVGTLQGKYELKDAKDLGKDVKVYSVTLKLREVIREGP